MSQNTNTKIEKKPSQMDEPLSVTVMIGAVAAFIAVLFVVYPLYYEDNYANMGEAKYHFFKNTCFILLPILGIAFLGYLLTHLKKETFLEMKRKLILTDWFVFSYTIAVVISFLLSAYKDTALWGYSGWYMGLTAQLTFVLLYFFVSRWFLWHKSYLWMIMIPSAVVYLLAVLHRFNIDPLHMYEGMEEGKKIYFLTTIGQATWYSSYLSVVLPIALVYYWYRKHDKYSILWGLYLFIGFATLVTQNSDSAFIAVAGPFLLLFWLSFESKEYFLRFWELVIILLSSFKFIGLLQVAFPEHMVPLESFSTFFSQSIITLVLLLVAILIYLCLLLLTNQEDKLKIERFKPARLVLYIIVLCMIPAVILCIYLNTTGKIDSSLLKGIGYFNFNEKWGNGRGFTWQFTWNMFWDADWKTKLIGCGPDAYGPYAYAYNAKDLSDIWGDILLVNAHNEWFNCLVNLGFIGLITYLGTFVTAFIALVKNWRKHPFILAGAASITSYFLHNFFCYQQVVCTPLIFIVIGMAVALCRKKEEPEV